MRAHYLQHVPFEGLGSIERWLEETGCETTHTRFYASETLPEITHIDLLIVMGGPMSIYDEVQFPWLVEEKRFIRQAIESGKAVLGICLGAQLIAAAMGARIYRNREKEIGWFPVRSVASGGSGCFPFPSEVEAFHWHGETFDLPAGAAHLARSEACENQAFQLGETVIGLQFHLETTPYAVHKIIENCRDELVSAPYIQREAEMIAAAQNNCNTVNNLMKNILDFITGTRR